MTPTPGRAYIATTAPEPARVTVGLEPVDRKRAHLARLFGLRPAALREAVESSLFSETQRARLRAEHRPVIEAMEADPEPGKMSLQEVYHAVFGKPFGGRPGRVSEAVETMAQLTNALSNTLNRVMLPAYTEGSFGEETLMKASRTDDFRTQRVVMLTDPPDLAAVSENGQYQEGPLPTDSAATAAIQKHGQLLPITFEAIANDDIRWVSEFIAGWGRSARRTLARDIWNLWINNATAPDGQPWFHSSHSNLQSAAISTAEIQSAVSKLVGQRRNGSVERLGYQPRPGSLYLTVGTVDWVVGYASNNATTSALAGLFGEGHEHIIVNSLLLDTNDWGLHYDSSILPSIDVRFFQGREVPEIESYANQRGDQMFTADRAVWRLKTAYAVILQEHRAAVKAVVA